VGRGPVEAEREFHARVGAVGGDRIEVRRMPAEDRVEAGKDARAGQDGFSELFLRGGAEVADRSGEASRSEARPYIISAPHTLIFPGLAIMTVILAYNLIGDGLRDALDPKLKR